MIKNFKQWESHNNSAAINEDLKSKAAEWTLNLLSKVAKKGIDDIAKEGFKGVKGGVIRKLLNATQDDISKLEKGLADVINIRNVSWWKSMPKESRKALEKEGEEIATKFMVGYHNGDMKMVDAARKSSEKYLSKLKKIDNLQKEKDKLSALTKEKIPSRKMKDELNSKLDDAQKNIDDAIKTGDEEKLRRAGTYVEEVRNYMRGASQAKGPSGSFRSSMFGRSTEEGANLADDTVNAINEEGKEGVLKKLKKFFFNNGKQNLKDLSKKSETSSGEGLWSKFKKGLKLMIYSGAVFYGGGMAWNYLKSDKQKEAVESIKNFAEEIQQKFVDQGVSLSNIDTNKASFSEIFKIFFAGEDGDLPVEDANDLRALFNSEATVAEFFSRMCQLCFEYPSKYFKENSDKFHSASKFYGFLNALNDKIGVTKIISAVNDADGMASKSMEETFFEEGSPISLEDYGYASFSNPNMKILLGSNEPVRMDLLLEESRDFLSMISVFKRKVMNDSIENDIVEALKSDGQITQEEFEEKSSRIEKELSEQLSEKEESFVAITGIILSYNSDKEPFSYFYGFDTENLYETVDQINSLMQESFDLRSRNQLSRIYATLDYEFSDVYKELGKQRTLYGVMEYSRMGIVMRSIMNLYALEEVCKIILADSGNQYDEAFTKTEVEEYQKVLKQIQSTEGSEQTIAVSGELDEETQAAMKQYQKKLGLPETGKPGEKSLKAMKDYLVSILTAKT